MPIRKPTTPFATPNYVTLKKGALIERIHNNAYAANGFNPCLGNPSATARPPNGPRRSITSLQTLKVLNGPQTNVTPRPPISSLGTGWMRAISRSSTPATARATPASAKTSKRSESAATSGSPCKDMRTSDPCASAAIYRCSVGRARPVHDPFPLRRLTKTRLSNIKTRITSQPLNWSGRCAISTRTPLNERCPMLNWLPLCGGSTRIRAWQRGVS